MTQKDKELLLKDLCSRLPYGVKGAIFNKDLGFGGISGFEGKYPFVIDGITQEGDDIDVWVEHGNFSLETVKPYLFPLSSMTEEQKREYNKWKHEIPVCRYEYGDVVEEIELYDSPESFEYLIENHFDYRGLIEKGLALDATGKNIY